MGEYDGHAPTLVVFGDSLSDNGNLFKLIGKPAAPYWNGRSSNGPTYAEDLAALLHVRLDDRAFSYAEASDASPTLLLNPSNNQPYPINLPTQIAGYIASLKGGRAPKGATAVINIGSNDYDFFLYLTPPQDITQQSIAAEIGNVLTGVEDAVDALTKAGVGKIVLYTLPDFALSPNAQAEGAAIVGLVHHIDVLNNAGLRQIAAAHPNVQLVDLFQLTEAFAADPQSFGLSVNLSTELLLEQATGSSVYAPNELAFFDGEHPTAVAHEIIAAFSDATLTSDSTTFLDGTQPVIHGGPGGNFIFATPIGVSNTALSDDYTIYGGAGRDIIYAGDGNVTVYGGTGNDLIFSGSGSARLFGGDGSDVLETNSTQTNLLMGGEAADALIANRAGANTLIGGEGNDLIILKESASLVEAAGGFAFGAQDIEGGPGRDTLRFIINDQNPAAEHALIQEYSNVQAAFDLAQAHHAADFDVDGLHVSGIERLELQVDSVSSDPTTPYAITSMVVMSDGRAPPPAGALAEGLQTAQNWNLLSV